MFLAQLLLALIALCCAASGAKANMASPYRTGNFISEPSGGSSEVEILKEDLSIDLTTLTDSGLAMVEAIYTIRADRQVSLPLLFVARALELGGSQVMLDGQPIQFDQKREDDLPPGWNVPPSLTLEGGESFRRPQKDGTIRFTLDLTPGDHSILVHYTTKPDSYAGGKTTVRWLLSYVLAPAKSWKRFGQLQIAAKVPSDWTFQSNLALTRDGDALKGSFSGIPSDDLSIIVQAPEPSMWFRHLLLWATALAMCAAVYIAGRRTGTRLHRRGTSALWMLPLNLILGVVCAILFAILSFSVLQPNSLGHHLSHQYSYRLTFLVILIGVVIAIATSIAGQLGVWTGKRTAQRSSVRAGELL